MCVYVLFPSLTSPTYIAWMNVSKFTCNPNVSEDQKLFEAINCWPLKFQIISTAVHEDGYELSLTVNFALHSNKDLNVSKFTCNPNVSEDQKLGVFDLSSTSSTYIALQPLGVFGLSSTSSTYIALQPLGVFDLSSTSSTSLAYIALQPLGVFDLSSTSLTYIALQPLAVFDLSSTSPT